MPIDHFYEHDGRVLRSVVCDPLTLREIRDSIALGISYADSVPNKVHVIIEVAGVTNWPEGFLKLTTERMRLTHPKNGKTVIIGTHPRLRQIGEVFTLLTKAPLYFCDTTEEAMKYLREAMAAEEETVASRKQFSPAEFAGLAARR